jgi:hypothetical protein
MEQALALLVSPGPATVAAQIAAIKARRPDYWRDEAAFAEASALWGGGHNEHGVFTGDQEETIARQGGAEATITVAQSPSGLFVFGVQFRSPACGFSYAPSIWLQPFSSREEARQAAIAELLQQLGEEPPGKRDREVLKRLREQVRAQAGPRQRELFV